ncbi:DUF3859 domain-containing protein [Saccharicrinis sp. FJH54]|uniref:DUF3859 domain-containing protein n=1 Tax=Saccharicrinis sp. FJH54 TaxID=3344665 RepID=UPI0035D507F9
MPKQKPSFEIYTYGIYSKWDRDSKDIPKIIKITDRIPAEIDIEFGYLLKIKRGKGIRLEFKIEHPPFKDDKGKTRPPFTGEHYVNGNDWEFFLGDTIWEPVSDKIGKWTLSTYYEGKVVAKKTLFIEPLILQH